MPPANERLAHFGRRDEQDAESVAKITGRVAARRTKSALNSGLLDDAASSGGDHVAEGIHSDSISPRQARPHFGGVRKQPDVNEEGAAAGCMKIPCGVWAPIRAWLCAKLMLA
mmetsp:Transcript_84376/g.237215  ORF Transcript_84376/g.237215 Transcript_84376/m.237215 type:complete len:113 (+) Transcript_84376:191-529(+)